jgi:hypothetical protein
MRTRESARHRISCSGNKAELLARLEEPCEGDGEEPCPAQGEETSSEESEETENEVCTNPECVRSKKTHEVTLNRLRKQLTTKTTALTKTQAQQRVKEAAELQALRRQVSASTDTQVPIAQYFPFALMSHMCPCRKLMRCLCRAKKPSTCWRESARNQHSVQLCAAVLTYAMSVAVGCRKPDFFFSVGRHLKTFVKL